jgi:hypothetical protein
MSLLACMCNQPTRLAEALAPVRAALVVAAPVSRWGMGYVQGGEVLLSRTPRRSNEAHDFYATIAGSKSDCLIGHAASDNDVLGTESTQPFRFRRWMFAQDDAPMISPEIWGAIAAKVPDFLRRNLRGRTLAELTLHTFLARLHDQSMLDDPLVPLPVVKRALADALTLMSSSLASAGWGGRIGNVAASDSRSVSMVRVDGGAPLYLRRLHCFDDRGARDDSFRGVLLLSGPQPAGEGAEEVPPGSLVTISRDLRVDIAPLS